MTYMIESVNVSNYLLINKSLIKNTDNLIYARIFLNFVLSLGFIPPLGDYLVASFQIISIAAR